MARNGLLVAGGSVEEHELSMNNDKHSFAIGGDVIFIDGIFKLGKGDLGRVSRLDVDGNSLFVAVDANFGVELTPIPLPSMTAQAPPTV